MASSGKSIITTEWWCRGALTAILTSPHGRQEIVLTRPCALIGSGKVADVRLTGPGILRRLLYIHAVPGGLFAVPLVEVSHFQPLPQGWLPVGVPLAVGPYRISFRWSPEVRPQEELPEVDLCRRGSLPGPGWDVEVRCDDRSLARIHIRRRLTLIGRHKPCAVQFADSTVSGCHCVVVAETDRLWVADLGSSNGTLLNGELISIAAWPEHSPLVIGRLQLIPSLRGESVDAPASPPARQTGPIAAAGAVEDRPAQGHGKPSDAPAALDPSNRRLRYTSAHPEFAPPHIALLTDLPQNNASLSDTFGEMRAESDPGGGSGQETKGTFPVAWSEGEVPTAREAAPVAKSEGEVSVEWEAGASPGDADEGRRSPDDEDGANSELTFATEENAWTGPAGEDGDPCGTNTFLVVPPNIDVGQWISEQSAGLAMQDDRSAAWAKDFVLSLLAEETNSQGDASRPPTSRITWSETIIAASELDAFRESPALLSPDDRAELLARRKAELAAREAFLHDFAKTLEEMSAELLHFQDSLLAEDDRVQREKTRLEELRARLGEDREALCREQETAMLELRQAREALHFEERRLAEFREEIESALARQTEERRLLDELRLRLEEERAVLRQDRQSLDEAVRLAREERHRWEAEQKDRHARHEADLAEWERRSAAIEQAQSELEEKRGELERLRAALELQQAELTQHQNDLQRQYAELSRQRAELDAVQRETQRRQNEAPLHDADDLKQEMHRLQAECARLSHELDARTREAETQHEQARAELARLQAEAQQAAAERDRLHDELQHRDEQQKEAERDRKKWEERLLALHAETERLQTELQQREREWEQRHAAWDRQQADWQSRQDAWEAQRRQWETQLADRDGEICVWESRYAELETRLAAAQRENTPAVPASAAGLAPGDERPQAAPQSSEKNEKAHASGNEGANSDGTAQSGKRASQGESAAQPGKRASHTERAAELPDFRRFISKPGKPEPILIPRLPPPRRSPAARWVAAAVLLAAIAAGATWYSIPRWKMTTATLDFSATPSLMHVRDGTSPPAMDAADLPFVEPFLPSDAEVIHELLATEAVRSNAVVAALAEPERELAGQLFISRSQDVPFMHLRLRTLHPQQAHALLHRWVGIFGTILRRKAAAAGRDALQRVEAEQHEASSQIAERIAQRKEIEDRLGTARPVELESRHLQAQHMATTTEQELGQLEQQIGELTKRRELAAATAALESPPVDDSELQAALAMDAEAVEIQGQLAALQAGQQETASAANAASASDEVAKLRARWEALLVKHRERLSTQKKQAAALTVETLAGELQTLTSRRDEVKAEIAKQRQIAADSAAAAQTLRQIERELPEWESRSARLAEKARQLQSVLAEAAGKGPELSFQTQDVHNPREFLQPLLAAVAAAFSVFAIWGVLALRNLRRQPLRYFIEQDAAQGSSPRPSATSRLERASP